MAAEWISTHILDTVSGDPAGDVPVVLELRGADGWTVIAEGRTDADGRHRFPVPAQSRRPGDFRLCFDVGPHLGPEGFFPEVTVVFRVPDAERHYHVPLLLSRFGYTTYRGS